MRVNLAKLPDPGTPDPAGGNPKYIVVAELVENPNPWLLFSPAALAVPGG
jgi:hypothetical protein